MPSGDLNDSTDSTDMGSPFQNLGIMQAETPLPSDLFLAVDAPEMLWAEHLKAQPER